MKYDDKAAKKKIAAMRKALVQYEGFTLRDGAAFLLDRVLDETINGLPGTAATFTPGDRTVVGVQTGTLRNSISFYLGKNNAIVYANLGIAPYARDVAAYVAMRNAGKSIFDVTGFFYLPEFYKKAKAEFENMAESVNAGKPYQYTNQFV